MLSAVKMASCLVARRIQCSVARLVVTCVDFTKSTYAWENGAVWCVNHGLETYYWICRSFEEEDDEKAVCRISIHEADRG